MTHRIFVFGATGYLGGAIAARLAQDGHEVQGLTRRDDGVRVLNAAGIQGVPGDLAAPQAWMGALRNADIAIHAASDDADPRLGDQRVLDAVKSASADGRIRRFLYTSGIWDYTPSEAVIDETASLDTSAARRWRIAHHDVAFDLAEHDVQVTVFQPGVVYGETRGLIGEMFAEAHESGTVSIPEDGRPYWPMVHRDDVADAYARALDRGPAGARLLLADGSQLTVREIAEAIARVTGARVQSRTLDELPAGLAGYGALLLRTNRVNAARARADLGWTPRHTSFVAEVDDLYGEWRSGRPSRVG
jgi:nucleoside-diphosphate-sugar epimerase